MTQVTFDPIKIGEARRYRFTVASTSLDLTTVTSFVFQVREQYDTNPVITETVLAVNFESVSSNQLIAVIMLNSSETDLLSARNYIVGAECRVTDERYPAIQGSLIVQSNPVS